MNEQKIRETLQNLNQEIANADLQEENLHEQLGRVGESGTLGERIRQFIDDLRERDAQGREQLAQELREAEAAVSARYPALAQAIRAAIHILDNAGL